MSVSGRYAVFAALFLALATGVAFRLWNLPAQVMGEDEINAVRSALVNPTSRILVTYQRQDNTIPLTALYRFLLDRGIKLTEMMVRMPAVLSGLALLLLAPWWVARRLGLGTAVVYATLLAISPGLVFYSRIARSYAPIVLFGFGALVTFEAWWRRPEDWRRGAAYVLLAALAAWFHPGAAPFVVSPFLFAAGDLLVRRAFRRLKPVVLLWLATVAAFLAFLLPARETLVALLKEKHGDEILVTKGLVLDVLRLQAGSGQGWLAVLFLLAAVLGLVRLFLWDSHLAALSAMAVLGQGAALLYLAPPGHEHPLISFRYLLIGLPWVLVWVAAALSPYAPARSSSSSPSFGQPNSSGKGKKNKQLFNLPSQGTRGYGRRAGGEWQAAFVAVVLLVALVLAGPFMDRRLWRSPFAHHNDFMTFMWPRPTMLPKQAPNFYTELATSKGRGAVLEYPWMHVGRMNRAFYLYQEIHGRDVVVAPARSPLADDRLAFLNMVPGTPEGFLASRARWLVVHRNLVLEETRIPPRMPVQRRFRQLFSTYGQQTIAHLTRDWGKPDRSDQWVAVWDLERVRRKTPPALKPPRQGH